MIHLPNYNNMKNKQREYTVEDYRTLAAEIAELPADQLERAIVLAASIPKAVRDREPADMKAAQVLFVKALEARYPFVEELLKAVNLYKVFTLSDAEPWKSYEKILAVVDQVEAINGERFTMAVMEKCFKGGAEEALLRGALQRHSSPRAVFAAYRDHLLDFGRDVAAKLHLDGEMIAGVGELRGLQYMTLFGTHTGTDHLDEWTTFAPFNLTYLVKSPKLANLLPLHRNIKSLTLHKSCADYTPLLQFENLEHIVVDDKDLGKVFALLGHRPNLRIDHSITASSDEASARLRAEYAAVIKAP